MDQVAPRDLGDVEPLGVSRGESLTRSLQAIPTLLQGRPVAHVGDQPDCPRDVDQRIDGFLISGNNRGVSTEAQRQASHEDVGLARSLVKRSSVSLARARIVAPCVI